MGDVRLRLALEEALVAALAETRRGVHDELGVGREWNAAVAGEVVAMEWNPVRVRVIGRGFAGESSPVRARSGGPSPPAFPNRHLSRQCTGRPSVGSFWKT
jgi:hypothetical protein